MPVSRTSSKACLLYTSVGGSAQTTAALGLGVRPVKGLRLGVDWNFFSRNFADYDINANVATQNEPYVIGSPWKIPSYSTFDLSAGYTFDFGKIRATLSLSLIHICTRSPDVDLTFIAL